MAEFHAAEPLAKGIAREELRGRALRGASPLVFRAVLDDLASSRQLTVEQEIVRAHQRTVTLGDEEARIRTALEERYRALGLQAPAGDEIIRELGLERSRARKIIHLLVDEHVLVKVADDVFVDAAAIGALIGSVRRLKAGQPAARGSRVQGAHRPVPEIRDAAARVSRRPAGHAAARGRPGDSLNSYCFTTV